MKIYKVPYRIPNGGYSHGDSCVSGGYYDTYHHAIVTATSASNARQAVQSCYPEAKVHQPKILGDA